MKSAIMFLVGACVGCAGTYILMKKKYENDIEVELIKMKQHYSKKECPEKEPPKPDISKEPDEEEAVQPEKPALKDYAHMLQEKAKPVLKQRTDISTDLRVLDEAEYDELSGEYRIEDLIVYSDGVVTDIRDNIVFDKFQDVIGMIRPEDFDEQGYMYVADDLRSRLYAISKDERSYKSVFEDA